MVMVFGALIVASAGMSLFGLQRTRVSPVMRVELLSFGFVMIVVAPCVISALLESITRMFAWCVDNSLMRFSCVFSSAWMSLIPQLGSVE